MRHLFSIFLSFWSKIPNHTAWRSPRVSGGHARNKMTQSPPFPLPPESDLSPSSTCPRSRLSNCAAARTAAFSSATSSRVSSSAFSPPPASHFSPSCSLPVQLYSHFCSHSCDWLVSHGLSPVTFTQWCFGCSSGKRVSMFVLFCYYPD